MFSIFSLLYARPVGYREPPPDDRFEVEKLSFSGLVSIAFQLARGGTCAFMFMLALNWLLGGGELHSWFGESDPTDHIVFRAIRAGVDVFFFCLIGAGYLLGEARLLSKFRSWRSVR